MTTGIAWRSLLPGASTVYSTRQLLRDDIWSLVEPRQRSIAALPKNFLDLEQPRRRYWTRILPLFVAPIFPYVFISSYKEKDRHVVNFEVRYGEFEKLLFLPWYATIFVSFLVFGGLIGYETIFDDGYVKYTEIGEEVIVSQIHIFPILYIIAFLGSRLNRTFLV